MSIIPRTALRRIFYNLSMEQCERFRRVCSTWNDEIIRMPAKLKIERIIAKKRCIRIIPIYAHTQFDDEPSTSEYIMLDTMSFQGFSRRIANIQGSISLDLRFCTQRERIYQILNSRCERRKWTIKQLIVSDHYLSKELIKLISNTAPSLEELKVSIKIPLKWARKRAKFVAARPRLIPILNKMQHLESLTLPAEMLMSKCVVNVELPRVKELTLTFSRVEGAEILPTAKKMRLSLLRCLNMCISEIVRNLQQKQLVLEAMTNTVEGILAENDTLQPCYLTVYLKASKEVKQQSDPWFEVRGRVQRPDVIILLREEIDKLF